MKKEDYDTKEITATDESSRSSEAVESGAVTAQNKKRTYHFAADGFTVEANTLQEAEKALKNYKKESNTNN